jgi:hypothetical protein
MLYDYPGGDVTVILRPQSCYSDSQFCILFVVVYIGHLHICTLSHTVTSCDLEGPSSIPVAKIKSHRFPKIKHHLRSKWMH